MNIISGGRFNTKVSQIVLTVMQEIANVGYYHGAVKSVLLS